MPRPYRRRCWPSTRPAAASSRQPRPGPLGVRHRVRIGWIDDHPARRGFRRNLAQQLERLALIALASALTPVMLPPGRLRLATSPSLTGSAPMKKRPEWCWWPACTANAPEARSQQSHPPCARPIGRHRGQPIVMALGPAILKGDIAAFDVAGLAETLMKRVEVLFPFVARRHAENPTTGMESCAWAASGARAAPPSSVKNARRLIRSPRRRGRAASAARSMPCALAVLRLMTSSTLVDCCTGRSAGFSPLRMRPA